jgi:hypothetical protein
MLNITAGKRTDLLAMHYKIFHENTFITNDGKIYLFRLNVHFALRIRSQPHYADH